MTSENHNPRIDDYLAKAPAFAQPIADHLRSLLHSTCPEVIEDIKWGLPHFNYRGEMMCVFAAATKHCSFTFLKQEIMNDPRLQANPALPAAKRFLGKITSIADLPPDAELIAYIREAMALNEQGIKPPQRENKTPKEIAMPEAFAQRLAADPAAKDIFEAKSQSFRKDYLVWINDAKTEATRQKRIDDSLDWIAQGKGRFWKYEKVQ
ncbi:YdeI family protein [Asticcacaulis sp. AND118]|uniref:YdeI/OmpD-associated family protein n=1 Tax=Asticcacaulis sp. AND118 TaxID=2840468 RepID=UPI001D00089D|nr:YdeI/OmpD-associated family protein [Asticcacaulis sp. AND118]UDF02849.1 YdeI/OmpD-associated family protein [Asticcacaulis sp. AND118]